MAQADQFYLRYYVGHTGKYGHEFLEFEFRPDGEVGTGGWQSQQGLHTARLLSCCFLFCVHHVHLP